MTTPGLHPSVDAFQALARSSPWRWRSLHFRHRSSGLAHVADEEIEVWLARPDGVRLAAVDGRPIEPSVSTQRRDGRPTGRWAPATATYRPDGFVDHRPSDHDFDDGLFWNNYHWVAMLDPVELSHHVRVDKLRDGFVAGRRAWSARLVAEPGYDPRCGGNCCELLYSEAGLNADYWDDLSQIPNDRRGRRYPDAYDAALDVGTGVVVRLHPVGGDADAPWLENDILEVDAEPNVF